MNSSGTGAVVLEQSYLSPWDRGLQSKLLTPFQENLTSAAAESREGEWQCNVILSHLSHLIVKDGGKKKEKFVF